MTVKEYALEIYDQMNDEDHLDFFGKIDQWKEGISNWLENNSTALDDIMEELVGLHNA
jgi:hypothetical protein